MRGLKLAFLLVLFFGMAFAQGSETLRDALPSFRDALPPWLPLLAIAIFIGYGIVAIGYMISQVFKIRELEAWAKTGVGEVTNSIFLVLIILIVLGFSDSIFTAATGATPHDTSANFASANAEKLLDVYLDGVWLSTAIGSLAGTPIQYGGKGTTAQGRAGIGSKEWSIGTWNPGTGKGVEKPATSIPILIFKLDLFDVAFRGFSGGNVFLTGIGTIQSVVLSATFISLASGMLVDFVQQAAIPVLVPFGMLMSSFSITRKLGRTMIAFGVGIHLFVPVSILMTQQMFNSAYSGPTSNPPEISEPSSVSDFTSKIMTYTLASLLLKTAVGPLFADSTGPLPIQLLCLPICAILASACLIFYAACFAGCFFPCFNFVQPMITYPVLKVTGQVIFRVLDVLNTGRLMAAMGVEESAAYAFNVIAAIPQNPLSSVASLLSQFYIDGSFNQKLAEITLDYIPYVLQYSVPTMLTPLIVLIVVVTAIRSISPAIGGEVQILGVSELI